MGRFHKFFQRMATGHAQSVPEKIGAHLDFAYACEDCRSFRDGVYKGACKSCGSLQVVFLDEILNKLHHRAKQRLDLARRMREAGYHNETAFLTSLEEPLELPAKRPA